MARPGGRTMDCSHARLLLPFARELQGAEAEELREHLQQCPDCGLLAAEESRCDQALGKAVRAVPLPAGLKTRIETRLHKQHAVRRWVIRSLVAACLLAAAGLSSWYLWLAPPEALDFSSLHQQVW